MASNENTNNYSAIPIKSESLLWKTAKLGAFFGLTNMLIKKTKISDNASDMISFGLVAAGTLLNTDEDENYSDDITALGSLLAIYSGHKTFKQALENPDFYKKAYEYADKTDELVKKANIFTREVYRRTTDSLTSGIAQSISKRFNDEESGFISKVFGGATDIAGVLFNTFSSGIKQLFQQGTNILDDVVNKSEYNQIVEYNKQNPEMTTLTKHFLMNGGLDVLGLEKENNDSIGISTIKFLADNRVTGPFIRQFVEGPITNEMDFEVAKDEITKVYKRAAKYQKISEQSFFKDILGEFTNFDGNSKSINFGRIIKDNVNYASALNTQVSDYLEEHKGVDKRKLTEAHFVNWLEERYQSLDNEDDKEAVGKLITSFYNQDNKVKFSELEKYVGKQISFSNPEDIKPEDRLTDENIINYIIHSNQGSSQIFNAAISEKIGANGEKQQFIQVIGINNIEYLKNFTFTDVVEYGKNKEVIDKTMGDGKLLGLRLLNVAENSVNAFYHTGLFSRNRTMQLWNPASLLDTSNRRKEYIANEINRMSAVKQEGNDFADIIIDGINFTTIKTEKLKDFSQLPEDVKKIVGAQAKSTYKKEFENISYKNAFDAFNNAIDNIKDPEKKAKFIQRREDWLNYASAAYLKGKNNQGRFNVFTEDEWEIFSKDRTTAGFYEMFNENEDIANKIKRVYKSESQTRYITQSTKQNDYKHVFRKKIVEAATEEISYAYENERKELQNGELKNIKGLDNKVKRLSNTEYNFTPFRYTKDGWKITDPTDDYFMENDTIVHSVARKIPFLKKITTKFFDKGIDPNEVKRANDIILDKSTKVLSKVINLLEQGGQVSPEIRKELEETIGNKNAYDALVNIFNDNYNFLVKAANNSKKYNAEELNELKTTINNILDNVETLHKEGNVDQLNEFVLKFSKSAENAFKKGNGVKQNDINKNFMSKVVGDIQVMLASQKIIKETDANDWIDLSSSNINKKLGELGFLFGKERNEPTKGNIAKSIRKVKIKIAERLVEQTDNDGGIAITNTVVRNLQNLVRSGAKSEAEADAYATEIEKFKPLLLDYTKARKLAKMDTFDQGNGNDLKGFVRNQILKIKGINKDPRAIYEDSFQVNFGNRLYNFLQKSSNMELLFEGDEESKQTVKKAYSMFESLDSLMSKKFSDKDKAIRAINKRISIRDGLNGESISTFNDMSLEDKLNTFRNRYYKTNQNKSSSVILRSGFDYDLSLRNIFSKLREFFTQTSKNIEERKKAFEEKIIKHINKNSMSKIDKIKTSFGTYRAGDTVLGNRIKGWASAAETAFEQLGIPRLSNIGRNVTWNERWKDFMLKRVGTIFAAGAGVLALDSFSDALIPDQIPIIGNGISGALAWGTAAARVGLQYGMNYTGITSVLRGLDSVTNGLVTGLPFMDTITMDAGELYDIHFKGKAVRINKNRFWHTAGRQSIQGEEFDQYRPSALYTLMNKSTGVRSMSDGYIGKWQKFFRKDFLFTKYHWYMIDPYREERIGYKKYGAVYPVTEQLFKDIPVIGDFMSATLGQIIKPTQYIGADKWLENGMIKNPDWTPGSDKPEYIKFKQPGIIGSLFSGFEDVKTLAGLQGYAITKGTEFLFGKSNPYERDVTLASITDNISYAAEYNKYNLGGIFNITEPIRRLIDDPNSLNMTPFNPLRQNLPYWMPEYFKKGNNPIMKYNMGAYIGPTGDFNKTMNHINGNENLNRFRILSMIAPKSKEFEEMRNRVLNKIDNFSEAEKTHYYESLGYAEMYGKREYANSNSRIKGGTSDINVTIKEKLTPYEFIGTDNKRYKLDTVTKDFNKLSRHYGRKKASELLQELDKSFSEGKTYKFEIANNATYSAGIDDEGDFLRVDSNLINSKLNLDKSSYRTFGLNPLNIINRRIFDVALPMKYEKYIGRKTVFEEWSRESVESNYFRDWDTPIDSFVAPYFTLSSNSLLSAAAFGRDVNEAFELNSNSTNILGGLVNLGKINYFRNLITGNRTTSEDYVEETKVHDKIEQYKLLAGKRNVYQLTGKEYFSQVKDMVNEQDSKMLMDLANVSNESERNKILATGNERLQSVLKMIWNRQQKLVNGNTKYKDWRIKPPKEISTFGIEYNSNQEYLRNKIKQNMGYSFSKLDSKRQGIYNSYVQNEDYDYIKRKMMDEFGTMPQVASTIYSNGEMFINNNY